jgi:hypothetical protein
MKHLLLTLLVVLGLASTAQATNYFLSPTGNNGTPNNGLSAAAPWLTFTYALANMAGSPAGCGHTLNLMDGVYGDGTSTGKFSVTSRLCTSGAHLTVRALNSRKARINDNGTGVAWFVGGTPTSPSAYIDFDGIVGNSTNNLSGTNGAPFHAVNVHHITLKNPLFYHPNTYHNTAVILFDAAQDILIEDFEGYDYHRHCITAFGAERVVVRRPYCNVRTGKIAGSFGLNQAPLGTGGAVLSFYPCKDCILENALGEGNGNLAEMNGRQFGSVTMIGSKILGSIMLGGPKTGVGIYPNARTPYDSNHAPTNVTIDHVVIHNAQGGVRASGVFNGIFDHLTLLRATTLLQSNGFTADDPNGIAGNSIIIRNSIAHDYPNTGFISSGYETWSGSNNTSFSNGTAYSPALPSNWSTPTASVTTDPGLGTCIAWPPDGSAAKLAGRGATILYRTIGGITGATPLWDPTTGEFPHGAIVAGINDVAGDSLFDVHTRLNINTGGCPFPTSYAGGTPPSGGAGFVTTEGTTSPSHARTITAGMDAVPVFIMLKDDAGNVGTVTGVTGCASEAYTLLGSAVSTPAYRRVYAFGKIAPTTGSCTISAPTSGVVTSSVLSSSEHDNISAFGDVVGCAANGATSATPSCTVPTTTGELLIDGVASKPQGAWTAGANQILQEDSFDEFPSPAGDIRGIISTKSGDNGGLMLHTGPNVYWAQVVVAMEPTVPDPPGTNELNVTKYGFFSGFGTEAGSTALAATNTPYSIAPTGMVRLRAEITAATATSLPFGFSLYCRKNAVDYSQVVDTFGSGVVRLYGPGVDADLPSSLTATTPRLTGPDGNSVTGAMIRDAASVFIAPQMANGKKIEMEWVIVLNAAPQDTVDCEPRFDSGAQLTTPYPVTPRLNIIHPSASGIASLPDQPWGLTATPNPTWGPRPSRGTLVSAERSLW